MSTNEREVNRRQAAKYRKNHGDEYREYQREYHRKWYKTHSEQQSGYNKNWHNKHPDYLKQYYNDHKEELLIYNKISRERNKELLNYKRIKKCLEEGIIRMKERKTNKEREMKRKISALLLTIRKLEQEYRRYLNIDGRIDEMKKRLNDLVIPDNKKDNDNG